MSYTKADFFALYRLSLQCSDDAKRPIQLGYHPAVIKPMAANRIERLEADIQPGERVAIIGGAFNWLGEALEDKYNCECWSVDTSDWVHEAKTETPDQDLADTLNAYSLTRARAREIMRKHKHGPRSRNPERVVRTLEEVGPIDWLLSEDVLQLLSDEDRENLTSHQAKQAHYIAGVWT